MFYTPERWLLHIVLPRSGSEPLANLNRTRTAPEPDQMSGSVAVKLTEPNARFSSRFKDFQKSVNLAELLQNHSNL
jgi:hypothetical protein